MMRSARATICGVEHDVRRVIARNETIFRDVNEALRDGHWPGENAPIAFRCECGELGCTKLIELRAEEYERIRSHPRRFLVSPGHEAPVAESVIETHAEYLVVQKRGEAGQVAEATDPRG
jgi:hypothetical protein